MTKPYSGALVYGCSQHGILAPNRRHTVAAPRIDARTIAVTNRSVFGHNDAAVVAPTWTRARA